MLDTANKLIEVLFQVIGLFRFFQIVDEDEGAVVLRLGRFRKTLMPSNGIKWRRSDPEGTGLHFVLPFYIDRVRIRRVFEDTTDLVSQNLTTADDRPVSISVAIRHRIVDVRKALIEGGDFEQTLRDSTIGAVGELVAELTYDELRAITTRRKLKNQVARNLERWGIQLEDIQISEFTRCRVYHLKQGA